MNAFLHHFSFEIRTGVRNKQLLLMNYLFPLGFYLLMGFIMPQINPPFRETLVPAMVVFAILSATLLGIPDPLVTARENGVFRSYKINGIPAVSILLIPALTTILHLVIVSGLILVTAPLLFQASLPQNWLNFLAIFSAMLLACAGISVLIGVVSANSRMTVLWSQIVFVPSMLLGGLMMPYNLLPKFASKLAQLLPATHAMNAFSGLAMGGTADFSPWGSVIVLLVTGLLSFGLAWYLFCWDSRNTTRRGSVWMAFLVLVPVLVGMFLFE